MSLGNFGDRFDPTTSEGASKSVIVLPIRLLINGGGGCLGIFLFSGDIERINNLPYEQPSTKGTLLSEHSMVRYCFSPSLEITVIPTNLRNLLEPGSDGKVQKTMYFLLCGGQKHELPGYRANIKLDFMIWHAGGCARKFRVDGAVLMDPNFEHLLLNPDSPVCLLGMDFITKHPHLLFEPKYDSNEELAFELAEGLFVDRSYDVITNAWGEVVIHIEGHHNVETGDIGCGVFFKSRSIFNSFCGVRRCDIFGNKLGGLWKERGILVGIVKALHIIEAMPIESDLRPTAIIIRTSSTDIEGTLAPIKWFATRIRPPYEDQRLQDLEIIFPPAIRDVTMYYYHNFVQKDPGFKIKFQYASGLEKSCGALAAMLLATTGSEMKEFCLKVESTDGPLNKRLCGNVSTGWLDIPDIILLDNHTGVKDGSLYVSCGSDGNFLIRKDKAHAAIKAADIAGQSLLEEDLFNTSKNAPEKKIITIRDKLVGPRMYGYQPPTVSDYSSSSDSVLSRYIVKPAKVFSKKAAVELEEALQKSKSISLGLSGYEKDWTLPVTDFGTDLNPDTVLHQGKESILNQGERLFDLQGERVVDANAQAKLDDGLAGVLGVDCIIVECGDDCGYKVERDCQCSTKCECGVNHQHKLTGGAGPRAVMTKRMSFVLTTSGGCGSDCECRVEGECKCGLKCRCGTNCKRRPEAKPGPRPIMTKMGGPAGPRRAFILSDMSKRGDTERPKTLTEISCLREYQNPVEPNPSQPYDSWRSIPAIKYNGKVKMKVEDLNASVNEKFMDVSNYRDIRMSMQPMAHKDHLDGHEKALWPYPYRLQPKEMKPQELPKCFGFMKGTGERALEFFNDQNSSVLAKHLQATEYIQTSKSSAKQRHPKGMNYPPECSREGYESKSKVDIWRFD